MVAHITGTLYSSGKRINSRREDELTCAGVEDRRGCRVSWEQGVEADDVLCVGLK